MITVLESHPSSHHFPSPLHSRPPHHSYSLLFTPFPITTSHHYPHPSSHHSPLTPLLIINPSHYIPSLLPSLPLTTPSHHPFSPPLLTYPPHHTSSHPLHTLFTTPLLTYLSHHTSSPHLLTTLFTTPLLTLFRLLTTPHHSSSPHPLTPTPHPHHSLKGHHNTKEFVKSHLSMSLNLCRTFLSLKTSFLIIFCKKKFWDKIDQKLEHDGGGGAHVLNGARATSSIHFSTCNVLPLKKTLITHFQVLFV